MIEFCMILVVWLLHGIIDFPLWAAITVTSVCAVRFAMQSIMFVTTFLKGIKE